MGPQRRWSGRLPGDDAKGGNSNGHRKAWGLDQGEAAQGRTRVSIQFVTDERGQGR